MSTSKMDGLLDELESLERRLAEAERSGDAEKAGVLEEKIRRKRIEIDNLRTYENTFGN